MSSAVDACAGGPSCNSPLRGLNLAHRVRRKYFLGTLPDWRNALVSYLQLKVHFDILCGWLMSGRLCTDMNWRVIAFVKAAWRRMKRMVIAGT
jgi:hypothetical protein